MEFLVGALQEFLLGIFLYFFMIALQEFLEKFTEICRNPQVICLKHFLRKLEIVFIINDFFSCEASSSRINEGSLNVVSSERHIHGGFPRRVFSRNHKMALQE